MASRYESSSSSSSTDSSDNESDVEQAPVVDLLKAEMQKLKEMEEAMKKQAASSLSKVDDSSDSSDSDSSDDSSDSEDEPEKESTADTVDKQGEGDLAALQAEMNKLKDLENQFKSKLSDGTAPADGEKKKKDFWAKKHTVYVKGIPWAASRGEIENVFAECDGGVKSLDRRMKEDGIGSGSFYIKFHTKEGKDKALLLNKQVWLGGGADGTRYMCVEEQDQKKMKHARAKAKNDPSKDHVLFVGGLPENTTKQVSLSLRGVIEGAITLCHVEWCIRQFWCSSIMLCNINSTTHDYYTDIYSRTYIFIRLQEGQSHLTRLFEESGAGVMEVRMSMSKGKNKDKADKEKDKGKSKDKDKEGEKETETAVESEKETCRGFAHVHFTDADSKALALKQSINFQIAGNKEALLKIRLPPTMEKMRELEKKRKKDAKKQQDKKASKDKEKARKDAVPRGFKGAGKGGSGGGDKDSHKGDKRKGAQGDSKRKKPKQD